MRRSPLHAKNVDLGARFTDFGGWEMPVRYDSVIAEHQAVRRSAGFFDVSHLGRFSLKGEGTHQALDKLLCNDIERISPGRCQYTMILNPDGGIVDDLIIWWWEREHFWVMPNAANHQKVMAAFDAEPGTVVDDLRETTALVAVQGPDATERLVAILGSAPSRLRTEVTEWEGSPVLMAGTGYTGEAGSEVCLRPGAAGALVDALVEAGVVPVGLGARDTLRLEAGLTLWGEDIDESTTPLEAGLDFAVSYTHEFVGRDALISQREQGVSRVLVGFVLEERGVPRHGHRLRTPEGGEGEVTSGNMSPVMGQGIGMGYISPPPEGDERLEVEIRGRWVRAHLAKPPFHK